MSQYYLINSSDLGLIKLGQTSENGDERTSITDEGELRGTLDVPSNEEQVLQSVQEGLQLDLDQGENMSSDQELRSEVEGGLTAFFNSAGKLVSGPAKILVPTLLGAALFPFFGPVGGIATAMGAAAMVESIQGKLEPRGLHLEKDTIHRIAEPLQGKQFNEDRLREVIKELLKVKQTNEDLKQFYINLVPTIQKAVESNHIEILGPVQGLIIGDNNEINQTFNSFLPS